jgi:hypothetical protein
MGFNRRKMEAQRAAAAEKEEAAKRATEGQILDEDAGRLVAAWNGSPPPISIWLNRLAAPGRRGRARSHGAWIAPGALPE